jgi:hypothetical protein
MILLDTDVSEVSLENSFSASANGWGSPMNLTLLGPFRIWMYLSTLRSTKV